jgi:phage baseplate assembly protein V
VSDKYEGLRRMFGEVQRRVDGARWIATGVVERVRKKDRRVIVSIFPEMVKTNWIRVLHINAGDNYITGPLPDVGSEVILLFIGADPNAAIMLCGSIPQDEDNMPQTESDYTFPIFDKYGNKITLGTDGIKIMAKENSNIELATTGSGKIVLNGGSNPVARIGDEVATPVGPGKIVGPGNLNVLA